MLYINKKNILLSLLLVVCGSLYSQTGYGTYRFLDLPTSSRVTSLGGINVSLADNDLNMVFQNPSLLSGRNSKMLALNAASYFAGIKYGNAAYALALDDRNTFALGVQYVDYGKFYEINEYNQELGTFTAKDMALNVSYARTLSENLTIGTTLKPVFLVYERRTSFGIGVDAGLSYVDKINNFSAGLVFRNIGSQLKGFYSEETGSYLEPLPFNIVLGTSVKLKYAPLRFSLTLHDLQRWHLNYQSTNQATTSLGEAENSTAQAPNFIDMAFRHLIAGIEFVPSNNFYLSVGYNHQRAQELKSSGFKSLIGFSFGGGIKLSKFHVGFGMAQYQVSSYSYHFSVSTSLDDFGL